MSKRLTVNQSLLRQRGVDVPWQVAAMKPRRFLPEDYTTQGKYLKPRLIESEVQTNSYEAFVANPARPCLYGVGSEPDDLVGKFFAAHLLSVYVQATPNSRPGWINLHDRRDPLRDPESYTFIVISSITPLATPYRMERLRDLIEHYDRVPRVVIVGGQDPVSFFAEYMHLRLSHLFFSTSQSVVERTTQIV